MCLCKKRKNEMERRVSFAKFCQVPGHPITRVAQKTAGAPGKGGLGAGPAEGVTRGHCQGRRPGSLPNVEMFASGAGGARRRGWTQPGSKQAQEDVGDRTPHLPSPHHSFPNTSAGARDPSLKRRSQPDSEGLDGLSLASPACSRPAL